MLSTSVSLFASYSHCLLLVAVYYWLLPAIVYWSHKYAFM